MLVYALFQRYLKLGENNCSFLSKKYTTLNYFRDMKLCCSFSSFFFIVKKKDEWKVKDTLQFYLLLVSPFV